MTDTLRRFAVSALITDCKLLIGAGVIPDSAVIMLADSIKKVEKAFDPPRLVVVGDAPAEEAQYDRTLDVVQQEIGARDV